MPCGPERESLFGGRNYLVKCVIGLLFSCLFVYCMYFMRSVSHLPTVK